MYALEIEPYMQEFAQPYFEEAGVDHKVRHGCWPTPYQCYCYIQDAAAADLWYVCFIVASMRRHALDGLPPQVSVVVGSADKGIEQLAKKGVRFDLAFLDADKGGYLGYYNQVLMSACRTS